MRKNHYIDRYGNSLVNFDRIWHFLSKFYKREVPTFFLIEHIDGMYSYSGDNNIIWISNLHYNNKPIFTITHESSHICLSKMTDGKSNYNNFRFIDEGLAEYFGYKIEKTLNKKICEAIITSKNKSAKGTLSIDRLSDWEKFFGQKKNKKSYDISLTLIYFLIEEFGYERMRNFLLFFKDTNDLSSSFETHFELSTKCIEKFWFDSLDSFKPRSIPLGITQIYPDLNYPIRPNTKKICIEFTQDIFDDSLILSFNPDDPVCFFYWINERTLILDLILLEEKRTYEIELKIFKNNVGPSNKIDEQFILKFETTS